MKYTVYWIAPHIDAQDLVDGPYHSEQAAEAAWKDQPYEGTATITKVVHSGNSVGGMKTVPVRNVKKP